MYCPLAKANKSTQEQPLGIVLISNFDPLSRIQHNMAKKNKHEYN